MSTVARLTARLAVVASFAALLAAACSPDSKDLNGLSGPTMSASRHRGGGGGGGGGGAASDFTVLSNAAVTCTRDSIVGDVGTFQTTPPGAVTLTEGCFVTGAVDIGGPAAVAAYEAFLDQYAALAPTAGAAECDLAHTLAATIPVSRTLAPGTYCTGAALTGTNVTLTLDARGNSNAAWIFKIGTLGTGALTGTGFTVALARGAQACNVTWWVSQAVDMTTSTIQGNILAGAAITMTDGTLNGNAWAGASGVGDVTFTGTGVTGCASGGKDHGHGHGDDDDDDGHGKKRHHGGDDDDGHGKKGHHGGDDDDDGHGKKGHNDKGHSGKGHDD